MRLFLPVSRCFFIPGRLVALLIALLIVPGPPELRPLLDALQRSRRNLFEDLSCPGKLCLAHRQRILALDHEDARQTTLVNELQCGTHLRDQQFQVDATLCEEGSDILRWQDADERETRLEARVLFGRSAEQL